MLLGFSDSNSCEVFLCCETSQILNGLKNDLLHHPKYPSRKPLAFAFQGTMLQMEDNSTCQ